ncbi:MAG: hypothetical protein WCA80_06805 [Candidatus Aquilonibacter sp.]
MNRRVFTSLLILALGVVLGVRLWHLHSLTAGRATMVALIYSSSNAASAAAWNEELRESGIPYEWISQGDLVLLDPSYLSSHFSTIVFPDHLDPVVLNDVASTMARYARQGGTLLIVDDSGTRRANGTYLKSGVFAPLLGLEYVRYVQLRKGAFGESAVRFANSQTAHVWHVPLGKLDDDSISSYYYGPQRYPVPATQAKAADLRVDASSAYGPALTERAVGEGRAFYVGIPLGYLRANSDGFPLQMTIQRVIVDAALTPHLVASPKGDGAIVINWHIDSNSEWLGIPHLAKAGLLRPDIRYNFDVTAGPDRDRPGDGEGFDACGAGAQYLRTIERYGSIGSHGGWLHNGFAWAVEAHRISYSRMKELIAKNDACLQKMTGKPVRDYAAPDGAHPQPSMTRALEALHIRAYYYTGDTGSAAERAFYHNTLVSQSTWAFPIEPLGPYASFAEMRLGHIPPARVNAWLDSVMDEAARDRNVLLFYSHSYDMQYVPYDRPFNQFLDRLSRAQREGTVHATVMSDASAFLSRLIGTTTAFAHDGNDVDVRLDNSQGLRDIAFALPKLWVPSDLRLPPNVRRGRDDARFDYFWIATDDRTLRWTYPLAKGQ